MRLAVLTEQLLAPVPGGTGRFTRELARALAASPGVEVTGWTAWHRATTGARLAGVAGPRRLALGRRPLSVAWEHGLGPAPRAADAVLAPTLLLPPRRGRPLLATVHDTVPWSHPETLTPRGAAFHRRMAGRLAGHTDAVLVPTAAVAAQLAEVVRLRPGQVHVVGEGVSAGVLTPPPDAVARRARLALPADYLLMVGTLEPRKGLDVALAALAALAGGPALVLVGPAGWGGVDPAALAASAGLARNRLLPLGAVSDADLAAVLAGARGLLAPSRAEGFGLPVAEALAAGVPVVCSDVPALVEVTAGAALVTPVGDVAALTAAVRRLLGEPGLAAALSARGRDRAVCFSWDAVAGRVLDVLAAVTGAGTA